jgi:hypothetical protein
MIICHSSSETSFRKTVLRTSIDCLEIRLTNSSLSSKWRPCILGCSYTARSILTATPAPTWLFWTVSNGLWLISNEVLQGGNKSEKGLQQEGHCECVHFAKGDDGFLLCLGIGLHDTKWCANTQTTLYDLCDIMDETSGQRMVESKLLTSHPTMIGSLLAKHLRIFSRQGHTAFGAESFFFASIISL